MADVNPAEISAILRQQLAGSNTEAELQEVGTILQVGDGIARAHGLQNAQYGELVEFENGLRGITLNLEEDNAGIVLLGSAEGVREGSTVKRTGMIASLEVGEGMLGRVVDTLGKPIDGKGPIQGKTYNMPLERKAPGVIYRQPVSEPLQTGIKAIDAMIPVGRGQRELIIGDRQTGKTTGRSFTTKASQYSASMWPLARKVQPLLRWQRTLKQKAPWPTQPLLHPMLLTLRLCSFTLHLRVLPLVNSSVTRVALH
jgi:F-type H+-transporting ATPase subunit alpha